MAQQLLHRANVRAGTEHCRCKAVPQRVRTHRLGEGRSPRRLTDGLLQDRVVQMVAHLVPLGVQTIPRRREDPLPRPLAIRVWILACKRVGQRHPRPPRLPLDLVPLADPVELSHQGFLHRQSGFVAALTSAPFAVVSGGIGCPIVLAIVVATIPELRRYRTE